MHEIFKVEDKRHYNLRYSFLFSGLLVKWVYEDAESLLF